MKCASILPLAFLLVTSAVAQEAVVRSDAWMRPNASDVGCPVGLLVKHGPGLPTAMNADGKDQGKPAQRRPLLEVQLQMTNRSPQSIVQAKFTVHGFSDQWKYIPLADVSHAPDLATTVEVALDVKGNGQTSHELALSRFTAVTAVDVDAISYANGSAWHASSPGACSASPDLVMRVNAER